MELKYTDLEQIFIKQLNQDSVWFDKDKFNNDLVYRNSMIKERTLHVFDQVNKMLNNFNWKTHKNKIENIDNANEQIIDAVKFIIGLFGMINSYQYYDGEIIAKKFLKLFSEKTDLVDSRYKQEQLILNKNSKVAVFDIDGVIADYDTAFIEYVKTNYGYGVSEKNIYESDKVRESYNYSDYFGVSKLEIDEINTMFIKDSKFRNIPVFNDAVLFIRLLKNLGIKIVLLTARESSVHSRIEYDTLYWLVNNDIPFDKIIYDKDKSDAIIRFVYPASPLFIVEDRDKHAVELSHLGHIIYLIEKDYNKKFDCSNYSNIRRIKEINEIKIKF
jgi:uncharacterized protein YktA (UPF0223 family)